MSRGKHMRSMEQVVKWVMWIYGSGGLGLAPQDNRFGSQQKVEMEILQRKCTKWKKNRKWQNLPIILKFLRIPHLNPKWKEGFFPYFSFCWHMLILELYFQVPMYSLLSWRFIVCLCRMLWVTTFPRWKIYMTPSIYSITQGILKKKKKKTLNNRTDFPLNQL